MYGSAWVERIFAIHKKKKEKKKVIAIFEAKNRNLTEPDVIVRVPLSNKSSQIQTAKSPHKWIIGIKGHSDAHPTYLSL